jgi:hypothetical protein
VPCRWLSLQSLQLAPMVHACMDSRDDECALSLVESPKGVAHPFLSLNSVYAILSAITCFMTAAAADGLNL